MTPAKYRLACATLGLLSLLHVAAHAASPAPDPETMSVSEWETLWTQVLARNVDDAGRIDFARLVQDHGELDRVVAFVAAVDPVAQPQRFADRSSRLAYYINAYNALAMSGVVQEGVPESLGGLKKIGFFYFRKFGIGGKTMSLYKLENDVIRPLGEPRIHFALNCMVVSCPRLPRAAFSAAGLNQQLDEAARTFMRERRNISVDPVTREVGFSAIFEFYTKDFLDHAPTLIDYANRYRVEAIPDDFTVRFLDYDWTVNDQKRAAAR